MADSGAYEQGYDEEFLDDIHRDFECPICHLPYRDPVQLKDCGHRFCKRCILRVHRDLDSLCPLDNGRFTLDGMFDDKACMRTVLSLRVRCKEQTSGCFWTGELSDIESHRITCPSQMVDCPNQGCNLIIRRRYLNFHQLDLCEWRLIECVFCSTPYAHAEEQLHNDQCTKFPVVCSQCKEKKIPREKMSSHIDSDCLETIVSCPFENVGCTYQGKRSCLQSHIDTETNHHLTCACSKVVRLEKELKSQEHRLQLLEQCMQEKVQLNKEKDQNIQDQNPPQKHNTLQDTRTGQHSFFTQLGQHLEHAFKNLEQK